MIKFEEIFLDNYNFFLKEIKYDVVILNRVNTKTKMNIKDELTFKEIEGQILEVIIKRHVTFEPDMLFDLTISYGVRLTLKDSVANSNMDWQKEFTESPVCISLINGLLSRISLQIAQITSSYGQNPLITPPQLIN